MRHDPTSPRTPVATPAGRVLIVDDDPCLRDIFSAMLARDGFEITTAGSVDEAVSVLRGASVDLVLSDVCMPDRSGFDLLDAVRGMDEHLPVLLITGAPSRQDGTRARDRGATGYLSKPITAAELRAEVREALERHRARADAG